MKSITESHIETFAIEHLQALGWQYVYGLSIALGAEKPLETLYLNEGNRNIQST